MDMVPNSTPARRRIEPAKDKQKSRIGNGSALLPGVDRRTTWVRRCSELIADHIATSVATTTPAKPSAASFDVPLCSPPNWNAWRCGLHWQAKPVADDIDLYARVSANLRRLLESVGLQRRARNVTPDLQTYLRRNGRMQAAE